VRLNGVRPIGDQAAGADEDAEWIDDGQLVPQGQRDDQIAMYYSARRDQLPRQEVGVGPLRL